MLERKFGPIPEPLPVKRAPDFYPNTSELFIGELVQAVKRSLMKGNIDLLELHDINELNNKTKVMYNKKETRTIPVETYNLIKNEIIYF
jgi:hypothetical protein